MTKGKYARRAVLRREDEQVTSELEAGRAQIVRLTGQVRELRAALATEQQRRRNETGRWQRLAEERATPELAALRKELETQRQRANTAEAHARRTREIHWTMLARIRGLLTTFGLSPAEQEETLLSLAGARAGDQVPTMLLDERVGVSGKMATSRERALALSAARGHRHRDDIVAALHQKMNEAAAGLAEAVEEKHADQAPPARS